MPSVESDALGLVNRLERIVRAGTDDSIEGMSDLKRILHSLKALAEHIGDTGIAELCHGAERVLAKDATTDPHMFPFPDVRTGLFRIAELTREHWIGQQPADSGADVSGARINKPSPTVASYPWVMGCPPLQLSPRERMAALEADRRGIGVHVIRVVLSASEPMPKARILLMLGKMEKCAFVIRSRAWVTSSAAEGEDPRSWIIDAHMHQLSGNDGKWGPYWYCILIPHKSIDEVIAELASDVADELFADVLPFQARFADKGFLWMRELEESERDALSGTTPGSDAMAAADVFLRMRRFMPGPHGLTVRSYLSFAQAWKEQEQDLQTLLGESLRARVEDLLRRENERGDIVCTAFVEHILVPELVAVAVTELLLQLLRNARAHADAGAGIREQRGKPDRVHVRLLVFVAGDRIRIQLSDDGEGISPHRVAQKAGLDEAILLSDSELLGVIIRPGFSTRESADTAGGTGMGLEVVRHIIEERLRGTWSIRSRIAEGLSLAFSFPQSLFPIDIVCVRNAEELSGLPFASIVGIVRDLEPEEARRPTIDTSGLKKINGESDTQWVFFQGVKCRLVNGMSPGLKHAIVIRRIGRDPIAFGFSSIVCRERVLMTPASDSVFCSNLGVWIPFVCDDEA